MLRAQSGRYIVTLRPAAVRINFSAAHVYTIYLHGTNIPEKVLRELVEDAETMER